MLSSIVTACLASLALAAPTSYVLCDNKLAYVLTFSSDIAKRSVKFPYGQEKVRGVNLGG